MFDNDGALGAEIRFSSNSINCYFISEVLNVQSSYSTDCSHKLDYREFSFLGF